MLAADLFAGLGGFSEGARQAGAQVALAVNHWPEAVEWHAANHPEASHLCQDIRAFPLAALPDLRRGLLMAAPACQGHSQAGQPARAGSGGSHAPDPVALAAKHRGDRETAWSILAAVEHARPAALVVENVPDFLRWDLFGAWSDVLRAMGYSLRTHVLNALDFGGAQDRARLILTGRRDGPELALVPSGEARGSLGACLDDDADPANRWALVDSKPERTRHRRDHADFAEFIERL